ncbi:fluoride efflux transporter CrcB [Bacillus testis]|uniref:fluoride efflux transporter CrcB n=1 Tax=Bacillus testis TaxID=1622072 RepID=UPI00067EA44C|nr:fluoride efflux transporter CrcB [Bacillus testis]
MAYILIGIAGALGAVSRYSIGLWIPQGDGFPFATLLINLSGSFLLSWLTTNLFLRLHLSQALKTAIGTGFVGSFTTFSALSVETVHLLNAGKILAGLFYVMASLLGGLICTYLGFKKAEAREKI